MEIINPNGQGVRTDLRPIGQKLNTRKTISKIAKVGEGTIERVKFIEKKADKKIMR